ncbi:hypothetical protein GJ496_001337 [Pomphorhynchus laevis]|nr:hypothetical protein GJ496_001337 [Pomphorhynchus laevis]
MAWMLQATVIALLTVYVNGCTHSSFLVHTITDISISDNQFVLTDWKCDVKKVPVSDTRTCFNLSHQVISDIGYVFSGKTSLNL